jgi:hypothetical protein
VGDSVATGRGGLEFGIEKFFFEKRKNPEPRTQDPE